ncbi:MAG: biopolymer transport protein ExbD [Saprospiraceae bacterium]|jgi:biopolymer transport protein ExbD
MGLKKRNKVNAEFSMSSLTDIIFLLLIFFMLTANIVKVDTVDLPEANGQTVAALETTVTILKNGTYMMNGAKVPLNRIQGALQIQIQKMNNPKDAKIGIAAEVGTSFNTVMKVMDIAKNLRKDAVLLTKPRED